MPLNDAPDSHRIEQSLGAYPKVMELILLGDLNTSLRELRDAREEDLATALVDIGLVNMIAHFMPRR